VVGENQVATIHEEWLDRQVAEFPPTIEEQWASLVQVAEELASRHQEEQQDEPTGEYYLG
jgi:hypothetical protein